MSRQNLSLINEHHAVGVTEPISISREEVSARVDVDVENSRYWEGGGRREGGRREEGGREEGGGRREGGRREGGREGGRRVF